MGRARRSGPDLDAWQRFGLIDKSDLLGRIEGFADDLEGGWKAARAGAPSFRKGGRYVSSVIVAGMGGSAIAGEIVADAFGAVLPVPMGVVQDYALPSFARRETLVVVSSYSGTTEETLSLFEDALRRGCRIVGITSGGTLKARLTEEGLPCFDLPGAIMPRAALPFLLAPLVEVLERTELARVAPSMGEAVEVVRATASSCSRKRPTRVNRAKKVALALEGGTPVVFGEGILRAAALRWRTQLNENAKVQARDDAFPASNHNDINAWGADPRSSGFRVVILRDPKGHPRNARRVDLTKRLAFKGAAGSVTEVAAEGEGGLARALSAVVVGDFASVYLAIRRGLDPTPVDVIQRLKRELAKP